MPTRRRGQGAAARSSAGAQPDAAIWRQQRAVERAAREQHARMLRHHGRLSLTGSPCSARSRPGRTRGRHQATPASSSGHPQARARPGGYGAQPGRARALRQDPQSPLRPSGHATALVAAATAAPRQCPAKSQTAAQYQPTAAAPGCRRGLDPRPVPDRVLAPVVRDVLDLPEAEFLTLVSGMSSPRNCCSSRS